MRLSELTVPELLALANALLRMARDIPVEDWEATREARAELTYVLKLIADKEDAMLASSCHRLN
jgi:hypothetical protein